MTKINKHFYDLITYLKGFTLDEIFNQIKTFFSHIHHAPIEIISLMLLLQLNPSLTVFFFLKYLMILSLKH